MAKKQCPTDAEKKAAQKARIEAAKAAANVFLEIAGAIVWDD